MRRRRVPSVKGLVGSLEYEVLAALWKRSPGTVNDVLDRLNARRESRDQLAYTTVMTVLSRLHEKQFLERVKDGRGYVYTPRYSEPELVEHLGQREVEHLLERYGPVALAQFAAALEAADPDLLRRAGRLASGTSDD